MMRRSSIWMSCLLLVLFMGWQGVACGPEEVKNKETVNESGGNKDGGTTAEKGTETAADTAGGDTTTQEDPPKETGGGDAGTQDNTSQDTPTGNDTPTGTDEQPDLSTVDNPTANPITMDFTPKSGETVEVKDFCIDIVFSQAPSKKGWSVKWNEKGKTDQIPALLTLDSGDQTKGKLCALVYLQQGAEYEIELSVKDKSETTLSTGKATYKTKDTYSQEKPADAGITTNMTLSQLISPAGLVGLLGGLNPDQLVPILAHLHEKDSGNQGKLTYIGAAGKAAPGQKPHQGKDLVDNDEPSSAVMKGTFSGRWFSVSSANFFFSAGTLSLTLEQFQLTGITSTDGKRIDEGSFTAIVDAATVKQQFGLDICLLLAGECFKGPQGRDLIRFAGRLKGVANPLTFSAFVPAPIRLSTGVSATPTVEMYFTEAVSAASDVTLKWESCTGSGDPKTPCDTTKGAKLTTLTVNGAVTLGTNKTSGTFTPSAALPSGTWIRLEISAKNANNQTTSTHTIFQTQ